MSGPPPGFSIPAGATGPPPGITGFPTSLPSGIPSGVIPSSVIPTGAIPSGAIPSGIMDGPPPFPPGGFPSSSGPPPFVLASFNSPDIVALSKVAIGLCWASCGLAVILVGLRLLTRLTKRGSAGWDDTTIVIAVLLSIGVSVSNTFQYTKRMLSQSFTTATMASQMLNFITLGFMRLSVAIFCLRLLPPNTRFPKYAIWMAILLNLIATGLNVGFFAAANQFPTNGGPPHRNPEMNRAFMASGIISVIVDFITVLTPLTVVRSLQMKKSIKLGVMIIMSLSLFTACLSIGKVIVVADMDNLAHLPRNVVRIQIFSNLEQNLGIIFASCPALRQCYGYAETKVRNYYYKSGSSSTRGMSSAKSGGGGGGGTGGGSGSAGTEKRKKTFLHSGTGSGHSNVPTGHTTRQNTDNSFGSAISSDTTMSSSANHDYDLEKGAYSYLPPTAMSRTAKPNANANSNAALNTTNGPGEIGKHTSIEIQQSDRTARDYLLPLQVPGPRAAAPAAGNTNPTTQGWDGPEPRPSDGGFGRGSSDESRAYYVKEKAPSVRDGVDCAVERGRRDFKVGLATRKSGWWGRGA